MRRGVKQFFRFGIVGGLAFVVDYGLLVILTELCGINYLISATISFVASVVFNYFASMMFVFTHKPGVSKKKEFSLFVALSAVGLAINNGCMYAGVEWLGIHYLITKIGATAVVSLWNFFSRKFLLDGGAEGDAGKHGHQPVDSGKAVDRKAKKRPARGESTLAPVEGDWALLEDDGR